MITIEQALQVPNAWLAGETDIIVIGSGHAGCEAALAAARLGWRTLLFGMNLDALANMPCNPNIGGTAKGQLVREIDALGGEMGRAADRSLYAEPRTCNGLGFLVKATRLNRQERRRQDTFALLAQRGKG